MKSMKSNNETLKKKIGALCVVAECSEVIKHNRKHRVSNTRKRKHWVKPWLAEKNKSLYHQCLTILRHHIHFLWCYSLLKRKGSVQDRHLNLWQFHYFMIMFEIVNSLRHDYLHGLSVFDALHHTLLDLHWDNWNNLKTRSPKMFVVSISAKQIYRSTFVISYPSFLIC